MDYEVGSIADLISGLRTPNRLRVQVRAVTPVKRPPVDDNTPRTSPSRSVKARKLNPISRELTNDCLRSPVSRVSSVKPVKEPKVREKKEKRNNNFQFLSQLSDYESDGNGEDKGEFVKEYYQDKNGIVKVDKKGKNSTNDLTSDVTEIETLNFDIKSNAKKNKLQENDDSTANKKKNKKNKQIEHKSEDVSDNINGKKNKLKRKSEIVLNEITNESKKNKLDLVNNTEDKELNISSKKSKKKKTIQESTPQPETSLNENSKKIKKNSSNENDTIDADPNNVSKKSKKKKNIDENNIDVNTPAEIKQEEQENVADEDVDQADDGLTDFQKAAQRRIQNKIKKDLQFEEDKVNRTIFVGNIPVSILKGKYKKILKSKFSPYGAIESIRIRNVPVDDLRTKPKVALIENKFHPERSTATAYIKFTDPSSVEKALVENNTKIEENHIRVDSCRGGSKPKVDSRKTLFLGNLPFNIEEQKVREFFEQFGTILSVRVIRDKKTQIGKGFGFVNFEKPDGVELALAVPEEDMQIGGKAIRLKRYNTYGPKEDAGKNQAFGDRNNQKSEKPYNKALNNGKKRDEQGNKLRKRNLPNQIKKIKPNKSFESNNDSIVQNDSTSNKHDESYKGTIAQKKKKNKVNKGILKKKRISKILTQDSKPRRST